MNDTTRCEPAEHLRGVDGWHLWRHEQGDIEYWWWFAEERTWRGGISGDEFVAGDPVMTRHRRYVAPVTLPAEVAALRAELAEMTEAKNAHITFQNHNAKLVQTRDDEIAALKREVERLRRRCEYLQDKAALDTLGWCLNWLNVHMAAEKTLTNAETAFRARRDALQRDINEYRAALAHKEPGDEG